MTEVLTDYERAHAFFDAGQPAEAVGLLDRVVEAAPDATAARELRARALFASAQLSRAEQACSRPEGPAPGRLRAALATVGVRRTHRPATSPTDRPAARSSSAPARASSATTSAALHSARSSCTPWPA